MRESEWWFNAVYSRLLVGDECNYMGVRQSVLSAVSWRRV